MRFDWVVGQDIAHDGDARWAITFVDDFFVVVAFGFARTFFDGPFDVVFGHADGFGVSDGGSQPDVTAGIRAALLSGDDDRF